MPTVVPSNVECVSGYFSYSGTGSTVCTVLADILQKSTVGSTVK